MTASRNIPSVSIFVEWNAESLIARRERLPAAAGSPAAFTHLMIYIVARALMQHPYLNATIKGDEIHLLEDINIGVAVALADGSLVVPVIRDAHRKSIADRRPIRIEHRQKRRRAGADPEVGARY